MKGDVIIAIGILVLLVCFTIYFIISGIITYFGRKRWWKKQLNTPITSYKQVEEVLIRSLGKKKSFVIDYLTKNNHELNGSIFRIEDKDFELFWEDGLLKSIVYENEEMGKWKLSILIGPRGSRLIGYSYKNKQTYWPR